MPYVRKEIPRVKLLISTTLINVEQQNKYLSFAKNNGFFGNTKFLGYLDYKMLPAYLTLADVVAQPSVGQSMNLTIKEAMSCGTPVITSLEGGEQFKNGTAGYLVDSKKISQLSDKITKLLENGHLRDSMGAKGRQIVADKFSWESVFNKIDREVDKLINIK